MVIVLLVSKSQARQLADYSGLSKSDGSSVAKVLSRIRASSDVLTSGRTIEVHRPGRHYPDSLKLTGGRTPIAPVFVRYLVVDVRNSQVVYKATARNCQASHQSWV
ncbi:hypothetical protein [Spirosoma panaciterrae]|uniref:hypothetical protein n=1 Tax=Spirosoma panaciterrae TaxID=496058 RepID=UPI001B7FC745|nr:hypothetical protein [Spirosoma panaciterrae]